jgi:hypothetical protein
MASNNFSENLVLAAYKGPEHQYSPLQILKFKHMHAAAEKVFIYASFWSNSMII